MRGKTQAMRLEKMMQRHIPLLAYSVTLPSMKIKSKRLKTLLKGDVLLLGISTLEMQLREDGIIYTSVKIKNSEKKLVLEVSEIEEVALNTYNTKKYKNIDFTLALVKSKKLEVGNTIEIDKSILDNIEVVVNHKTFAYGTLVNVNNKIAIEINKVI
ncbi:MAG: FliM/FliN family flagellar motor C-terminal domain-containing protein [Campylobacterota bacterium]|nr:FliM/FliN family flagellar motor C-terminal domain-containing protein [Campylobacterota bacterium]